MIGRKQEVDELRRLYERNRAELVAVYGRRRVGKTFLVDEAFSGKFTFRHAGLSPVDVEANGLLRAQLDHFYNSEKLARRSFHSFTSGVGERIFISLPRVNSQPQKVGDF